jgi:hypothetical protein
VHKIADYETAKHTTQKQADQQHFNLLSPLAGEPLTGERCASFASRTSAESDASGTWGA